MADDGDKLSDIAERHLGALLADRHLGALLAKVWAEGFEAGQSHEAEGWTNAAQSKPYPQPPDNPYAAGPMEEGTN